MTQMKIRPFEPCIEDAEKLLEVEKKVFGDCTYSLKKIIEISQLSENKIFVAEVKGKIIGFVSLLTVNTLHYYGVWVDLIGVDPDYQGKGIGKKLLSRAKEYGMEKGVQMMSGLIAKNNLPSQKAFQKENFTILEKDFVLAVFNSGKHTN